MTDETRNPEQHDDSPQVFAVSKNLGGKWKFNRRDFLKATGATAGAAMVSGTLSGKAQPTHAKPSRQETAGKAHRFGIRGLAISADGLLLASGSQYVVGTSYVPNPTIKLWSMPEGALIGKLAGEQDSVGGLAISPDNTILAAIISPYKLVGSAGSDIRIWSLPDIEPLTTIAHSSDIFKTVVFSPNGTLASSTKGSIKFWSVPDSELINTLSDTPGFASSIYALAFSPDGSILAAGRKDNTIHLWSTYSGERLKILSGHTEAVTSVAINPDGTLLVSGGGFKDNTIKIWSLPEGELVNSLAVGEDNWGYVSRVAFSADGSLLISADSNKTIKLWSVPDWELVNTLTGHTDTVNELVISSDGSTLYAGDSIGAIKLWSLPDGEYQRDLIDIAACVGEFEGVQYSLNDSGESVVTLPCDSPIPDGANCICNCVQGGNCSCVGASSGGGSHYWHPN